MQHRIVGMFGIALLVSMGAGCQSAPRTAEIDWDAPGSSAPLSRAPVGEPSELEDTEGVDRCYIDGAFCIASQPSAEALRGFKEDGVTVVINLRMDSEMEGLDYDEAALCEAIGLDYAHIPMGGRERVYPPEAVDRFAEIMDAHDGKALIHCASGGRATSLYVAYLIKHRGYELADAMEVGMGLTYRPMPLELLLDRRIGYHWED